MDGCSRCGAQAAGRECSSRLPRCLLPSGDPARYSRNGHASAQAGFVLYLALLMLAAIGTLVTLAFTAQRLAEQFPRRQLAALQSRAAAVAGLELAREYVMRNALPQAGERVSLGTDMGHDIGAAVRLESSAGWCRVTATGGCRGDTVILKGVLGQRPPPFAACAATFESCGPTVTIGARAVVHGDIAAPADAVRSEFGGEHRGALRRPQECGLNDTLVEAEMAYVDSVLSRWIGGFTRDPSFVVVPSGRVREIEASASGRVLIEGDLSLDGDTLDLTGRELWITGSFRATGPANLRGGFVRVGGCLEITGTACVENATLHVLGPSVVAGSAKIRANLLGADSITISGNARVLYPSFLYLSPLYERRHTAAGQLLTIDGAAHVYGTATVGTFARGSLVCRLLVRGRSFVEGIAYSYTNTTMFGRLSGSLYTHRVMYRSAHSVQDGYLKECRLSHLDLSNAVIPLVFAGQRAPAYVQTWEEQP